MNVQRRRLLAAWAGTLASSLGLAACSTSPEENSAKNSQANADPWTLGTNGTNGTNGVDELPGCDDPTALMIEGQRAEGYVVCPNTDLRARVGPASCPNLIDDFPAGGAEEGCQEHADCTDQPLGYCTAGGGFAPGNVCVYGCTDDDDCGSGQICDCRNPVGQCVATDCLSGSDCGEGLACTRYERDPHCGPLAYACQTEADTCASDSDCTNGDVCTMEEASSERQCGGILCAIGRPFIVAGEERLAPLAERSDWLADLAEVDQSMAPEIRQRLTDHWATIGLMEHASVAAFARSALHLMLLGAPPELLSLTHAAMEDETQHARLCFALASQYGGRDLGPGELELDGAFGEEDLISILSLVIEEGCVGETTAALEAAESAELAADPTVVMVLQRIAQDEQRHAELGWATLKWALEVGDDDVRLALRAAFEQTIAHLADRPLSEPDPDEAELLRHGVFTDRLRDQVRRDVINAVVLPTFDALWAEVCETAAAA